MLKKWIGKHIGRASRDRKREAIAAPLVERMSALDQRVAALETQLKLAEDHQTSAFWHALDRVYDAALKDRGLNCIICGQTGRRNDFEIRLSRCIFGGGRLERYECPACECVFGSQKFLDLGEDLLGLEYRLLYSRYREGNTTPNEIRTFQSLDPQKELAYVN
jgi:hypothetical protein